MKEHMVIGGMITAAAALLALLFVAASHENEQWKVYVNQHGCVLTGDEKEDWYMMPVFNGTTTTLIPQEETKHEWKCDDGFVWR